MKISTYCYGLDSKLFCPKCGKVLLDNISGEIMSGAITCSNCGSAISIRFCDEKDLKTSGAIKKELDK